MTTIIQSWPPNIDAIRERFPGVHDQVIFAWEGKIYNPSGGIIPDYLIAHEEKHFEQQKAFGGAEKWWEKYLTDNKFLIAQEAEAYHAQYTFFCEKEPNMQARYKMLLSCATALSGPVYGNSISKAAALFRIKYGK